MSIQQGNATQGSKVRQNSHTIEEVAETVGLFQAHAGPAMDLREDLAVPRNPRADVKSEKFFFIWRNWSPFLA